MINTHSYPRLDEAHASALFQAIHRVVQQSLDDVALLSSMKAEVKRADVAMFRSLPPKHQRRYDLHFARQFSAAIATVTWKLTEPDHVFSLACRAEELALKYVVDTAEQIYRSAQPDSVPEYDQLRERLFEDDDYLRLWDQEQEEVEDAAFEDWFEPFRETEQVHPFSQMNATAFSSLWSDPEGLDEIEDPEEEVYLLLGEDWLDIPNQIADKVPSIIGETRSALFPQSALKQLSERDRTRLFDSAAEDVRLLLEAARSDRRGAYDVWLVGNTRAGQRPGRFRLHAGVPLDEALELRRFARAAEYREATNLSVRVYPSDHEFDPRMPELRTPPVPEFGEFPG